MNNVYIYNGGTFYLKSFINDPKEIVKLIKSYKNVYSIDEKNKSLSDLFIELRKVDPQSYISTSTSNERTIYSLNEHGNVELRVSRFKNNMFCELYSGSIKGFEDSLSPVVELRAYKTKLVRFKYDGGTVPGLRVIRMEDVFEKNGKWFLSGTDMAHELNPESTDKGYRQFDLSKISGKIEVIS